MRRVDLLGLLGRYLVVGLASSALVAGHAMSGAAAARLGAGLVVVWTALYMRKALWPSRPPGHDFEVAVEGEPGAGANPPPSYRSVAYAVSLACAPGGGDALETRLRPLLREIAAQRLAAHRGIGLLTEPSAACELLGEDLFALVSRDHALRNGRGSRSERS
ncbi:MAG TPA: hypothetical protein VFN61_06950, partial [Acidimicrobiales bacterium]|nr:hypothetical protein [Acidimicrobiales bacterium]